MVSFSGTVESDFLKLVNVEEDKKSNLIDFGAVDFASLKSALVKYIKAVYPLDYQNFAESDLGIMLVELVAYMGSIATMKADFTANELFLRTARNRKTIKKLLELIGVRMKGPISAAANASITLNTPPSWVDNGVEYIEIPVANRVISITSPEDGASLNYTLYKVISSGRVDLANSESNIILYKSEGTGVPTSTFSNLVLLEGSLIRETGTFNTSENTKIIDLSQKPVVEGSVEVYINGTYNTSGAYREVENIFSASGASDKVYQLVTTDRFAATILFGDSLTGVSPNTGDTYTVTYRVGGGSRGNIKNEVINTTINVNYNDGAGGEDTSLAAETQNISLATGGADAESVEHVKRYAPLTFRRQDRVVTIQDFKTFANTFISSYGSKGKATAVTRRAYCSANIIDLYVLEKASDTQLRKATPEFKLQMLDALEDKKMLTDEIIVVDGLIRTFDLGVSVYIDKEFKNKEEEIKLKVRDRILNLFNVDNTDFGKEFRAQDLNREIYSIDEVRYSEVTNLEQVIRVNFNEILQLNNIIISIVHV